MSTLHEQIKERIDGVVIAAPRTAAALLAVVERHRPVPCSWPDCGDPEHQLCAGCGHAISWPEGCPDTMAIARELGVEVDGD